ncbi:MAG: class D sortase [Solirubrobacterales bacterium]|nr:class D sortase [Solirubrobacterales bacterium]
MVLEVTGSEHVGGAPGAVVVRVHGRTEAAIAPPALLIEDGDLLQRVPPSGAPVLLPAGPFALDYVLPLHVIVQPGDWWLEPPYVAGRHRPAPDVADLRARVAELGAEIAALKARLAAPAPEPVRVPRPRRLLPTLPAVLMATGALAVADAVATVVWQEPLSALYSARQQSALGDDLARLDRSLATAAAPSLPDRPEVRMRALARTLGNQADPGEAIGRLEIPRLGARQVVVQGTGGASLRKGPGHYGDTVLPGEPGTVGIAGHRTTYGAPFRHLDDLRKGDAIDLRMPYGSFRYRVEGTRIVKPEDVSVFRPAGRDRLALTACHPLYSAAQRIVVVARLERATPRGAATPPTRPAGPSAGGGAGRSPAA